MTEYIENTLTYEDEEYRYITEIRFGLVEKDADHRVCSRDESYWALEVLKCGETTYYKEVETFQELASVIEALYTGVKISKGEEV